MKQIRLFMMAVLVAMGCVSLSAMEKHADLSKATKAGSNATSWDGNTGTFAWKGSSDARVLITDIAGDLSAWDKLVVVAEDYTASWRIDFEIEGISGTTQVQFYSDGKKEINIAEKITDADQRTKVASIRINTNSNSGSIRIKDIYLVNSAVTPFSEVCQGFTTVSNNTNCEYNVATATYKWTSNSSNTMQIFSIPNGELAAYEKLTFTTSNLQTESAGGEKYRVLFMANGTTVDTKRFASAGSKTIMLKDINLGTKTLADIDEIRFAGYSNETASIVIRPADIVLVKPVPEEMSLVSPISGFEWYSYSDGSVYGHTGSQLQKQLGTSLGQNKIIYGPYSGDATTAYMDVTDYDEAVFTLSEKGTFGIRLMYNSQTTTIETNTTNAEYVQSLNAVDKIANIKTKNVSGASNITVSTINFRRSFITEQAGAWTSAHDVENTAVNYSRKFTIGQTATVCLPFDLTAAEATAAGTFYELVSFADGELGFNIVTEPLAYVPYLIDPVSEQPFASLSNKIIRAYATPEVTIDGVTFCGTMQHTDNLSKPGYDLYGYSAADGLFVKVGDNVSVKAFRAYIAIPAGTLVAPRLRVTMGTTVVTDVEQVEAENASGVYYNIMGQRVSKDTKGIVICNGKKMLNW